MLRRYLSLAIPVMFSAAVALLYLHFRQAPAAAAPAKENQVAQAPEDPFAPPVKPATPEVKPAAPTAPETKPVPPASPDERRLAPRRTVKPKRATPKNDDEVQSPFLKNLLVQLGAMTEGTDEDKAAVRQMIYDADVELSDSLGPNARRRIEAYSNKNAKGFVVGGNGPRTATGPLLKRTEVGPNGEILRPAKPLKKPDPMKKPDPFQDDKPVPPPEPMGEKAP
jgi:hypothetical protein